MIIQIFISKLKRLMIKLQTLELMIANYLLKGNVGLCTLFLKRDHFRLIINVISIGKECERMSLERILLFTLRKKMMKSY